MPESGAGLEPAERARLDREDEEERELIRPPDVNRDSNRSATRLELFFDLAFVLFVARCADVLAMNETVAGGLQFAAILAVGWWAWASSTLYANRFDTDDAIFRLLTLTGMAGVICMAAAADKVMSVSGHWFALGYVLLRVVLVIGYLRVWRQLPHTRAGIRPYLFGHAAGAACWLISLTVPPPAGTCCGRWGWLWTCSAPPSPRGCRTLRRCTWNTCPSVLASSSSWCSASLWRPPCSACMTAAGRGV